MRFVNLAFSGLDSFLENEKLSGVWLDGEHGRSDAGSKEKQGLRYRTPTSGKATKFTIFAEPKQKID